jgi:hypothetical protein
MTDKLKYAANSLFKLFSKHIESGSGLGGTFEKDFLNVMNLVIPDWTDIEMLLPEVTEQDKKDNKEPVKLVLTTNGD